MRRTGWESAALGSLLGLALGIPSAALAQAAPPLLVLPSATALPSVPELRLDWPISPSRFSFTWHEELGYADGPLRLFRAEALWLTTPGLQLLTASSAERAFELDCRLTCQPIIRRAIDLELRMPLSTGAAEDAPYAFVRTSSVNAQSASFRGLLGVGIAGALNF
jgi:hypothetical protein